MLLIASTGLSEAPCQAGNNPDSTPITEAIATPQRTFAKERVKVKPPVAGSSRTTSIYLECPKETLLMRLVKNNSRRPLLAGKSEEGMAAAIDEMMQRREEIYRNSAHHVYHTAGKKMRDVIEDFSGKFSL